MILVTVGSTHFPFDRLVRSSELLSAVDDRVVVQRGPSTVDPVGVEVVDFLPYDELLGLAASARVVVCHAGVGSIMLALGVGKRPVVVPRRAALGEAVDDHQVQIARALAPDGTVFPVEDVDRLADVVRARAAAPACDVGLRHGPLVPIVAAEAARALVGRA